MSNTNSAVERARGRRAVPAAEPRPPKRKAGRPPKSAKPSDEEADASEPSRRVRAIEAEHDLTPAEIAIDMRRAIAGVYKDIRSGALPAMRMPHGYRVSPPDYRDYREALKALPALPRRGGIRK